MSLNPNAADRDGLRERALADLGIDVEVTHVGGGKVQLGPIDVSVLDRIIDLDGAYVHAAHDDCYTEDDVTIADHDGYDRGHKAAIAEVRSLTDKAAAS
jgi:hypothetical protein